MPSNAAALQRLINEAKQLREPLPRDVQRFALAGYLIGAIQVKYSDDQPRDDSGRWSDGGGGGGGSSGGDGGNDGGGESGGSSNGVEQSRIDRSEDEFRHYAEDDDAEVNQTLGESHKEWEQGLTSKEKDALKLYTTNGYEVMNGALRNHNLDPDRPPPSGLKDRIKAIDKSIDKAPGLPEDTMLYRGINERNLHEQIKSGGLKKGSTLTDRGLASTSPQIKETEVFIDGNHPVMYKIRAEKGAKGAYLGFKSVNPMNPDEAEFLLPRNAKMTVVDTRMNGNIAEVELAYLAD